MIGWDVCLWKITDFTVGVGQLILSRFVGTSCSARIA